MVMSYVNILKYLEHIFNKQLQNGYVSGNVKIVWVISILKMYDAQEFSLTTSQCLVYLSSRKILASIFIVD